MTLIKTQPPITVKPPERGEYGMRFEVYHRKRWAKMQPAQQAVIMRASAEQLRTWAEQMESEAEALVTGDGR